MRNTRRTSAVATGIRRTAPRLVNKRGCTRVPAVVNFFHIANFATSLSLTTPHIQHYLLQLYRLLPVLGVTMKVLIVGAGSVGQVLGAHLQAGGVQVEFLVKPAYATFHDRHAMVLQQLSFLPYVATLLRLCQRAALVITLTPPACSSRKYGRTVLQDYVVHASMGAVRSSAAAAAYTAVILTFASTDLHAGAEYIRELRAAVGTFHWFLHGVSQSHGPSLRSAQSHLPVCRRGNHAGAAHHRVDGPQLPDRHVRRAGGRAGAGRHHHDFMAGAVARGGVPRHAAAAGTHHTGGAQACGPHQRRHAYGHEREQCAGPPRAAYCVRATERHAVFWACAPHCTPAGGPQCRWPACGRWLPTPAPVPQCDGTSRAILLFTPDHT